MRLNKDQKRLVDLGFQLLDMGGEHDPATVSLFKEMRLALWGDVKVAVDKGRGNAMKVKPKTETNGNPILELAKTGD